MNNNQGRRRTRRVRQQRKQKNTQISRILLTICMMALVAVVSIGGTIAWLTDKTETVTNTFTNSDIDIELAETENALDGDSNALTNSYKMVPGVDIAKDPKVTYKAGNEAGWLFVKLEKSTNFDNYMEYTIADGWTEVPGNAGVYYKEHAATLVDNAETTEINEAGDQEYSVLKDNVVKVKTTVDKALMDKLEGDNAEAYPTLKVTAYAVQKEAATDAASAWTLAQQ